MKTRLLIKLLTDLKLNQMIQESFGFSKSKSLLLSFCQTKDRLFPIQSLLKLNQANYENKRHEYMSSTKKQLKKLVYDIANKPKTIVAKKRLARKKTEDKTEQVIELPKLVTIQFQTLVFASKKIYTRGWKPCSREGGCLLRMGKSICLIGGINHSDFNQFSILQNQRWSRVNIKSSISLDNNVIGFAYTAAGKNLYFFGGIGIDKKSSLNRQPVHYSLCFSEQTQSLTECKSRNYQSRCYHSAIHIGRYIVIFGGLDTSQRFVETVQFFLLDYQNWVTCKAQVRIKIACHGAVHVKRPTTKSAKSQPQIIYVFGGVQEDQQICSNSLLCMSIYPNIVVTWRQVQTNGLPPAPRMDHSMHISQDCQKILIFGGRNKNREVFGDLFVLQLVTLSWCRAEVKGVPVSPRYHHCSLYDEGSIIITGGLNGKQLLPSELIQLSPC